jgi:hypothetical protein
MARRRAEPRCPGRASERHAFRLRASFNVVSLVSRTPESYVSRLGTGNECLIDRFHTRLPSRSSKRCSSDEDGSERSEQSNSGSRAAVLRRRESTRLLVGERRRSRRPLGAIRSERSEQSNSGSRAAVLRRRDAFSSASNDEVGGLSARSAASGASNQTRRARRATPQDGRSESHRQKDTPQVDEIDLRPVTNPLLLPKRPPFELKTRASSSRRSLLVLRQRQDSGNLSSYEEIWSAQLVV